MHERRKAVSKATGWEMEIAVVGLGRMGANIARRLARGGHRVVVFNRSAEKALELAKEGSRRAISARSSEKNGSAEEQKVGRADNGPTDPLSYSIRSS